MFEIVDQHEQQWGIEHVLALLPARRVPAGLGCYMTRYARPRAPGPLEDDFSALLLRFP